MKFVILALRNLARQKRRTVLLGSAIAFGIMIVTIINGFAGSFVENVSENFSHLLAGHVFVEGVQRSDDGTELRVIPEDGDERIISTLMESNIPVEFVTKRSEFSGAISFAGESVRQTIVGVDFAEEDYLEERLILLEGDLDNMQQTNRDGQRNGLIISQDIAEVLNVQLEDRVIAQMETVTGQQNIGDFFVAGISYDPNLFGSLSGYADLAYVNSLLDIERYGEYQSLGIFLDDIQIIDQQADRLYELLGEEVDLFARERSESEDYPVLALFDEQDDESWEGTRYRIYTLNDVLSEVDQIVDLLNQASLIILLVLFLIIMVGITNTFRMVMYERVKEIGTMRALGMQRAGVLKMFLLEALFLALGGALAGLAVAGVVMGILAQINWGLDSVIYILLKNGYFTFRLLPQQVLLNFSIVAGLTVLAASIPSIRAARMQPVDALRQ